jgi:hypothetical protein
MRSTHHKPMIHGLLEVDVTDARASLRDYQTRTGEPLSFTAFIIVCLAKAVDENKAVHALRWGSSRVILFADVDVLTWVERDVGAAASRSGAATLNLLMGAFNLALLIASLVSEAWVVRNAGAC